MADGDGADASESLPLFDHVLIVRPRSGAPRQNKQRPTTGYGFSAECNAVPLGIGEFMPATGHYPIVFTDADKPVPIALLGLEADENLFLEPDGRWLAGAHVPAYFQRELDPLDIGDATDHGARDATRSIAAFDADRERTECFADALSREGLLVRRHVDIELPGPRPYRLSGFLVIDIERLRNVPAAVMRDWRVRNWTDLIALHIASMRNWEILLDLHALKSTEEGA